MTSTVGDRWLSSWLKEKKRMLIYKEEKIEMKESGSGFRAVTDGCDYQVNAPVKGVVYFASTRFGDAYALTAPDALGLAQDLIDQNL